MVDSLIQTLAYNLQIPHGSKSLKTWTLTQNQHEYANKITIFLWLEEMILFDKSKWTELHHII